jgi:hypothetical protein
VGTILGTVFWAQFSDRPERMNDTINVVPSISSPGIAMMDRCAAFLRPLLIRLSTILTVVMLAWLPLGLV